MPTLNSSNPLVSGLVFLAPFQENILPYTDDAGGRSVVATDATIQLSAPGPALAITAATTSKAQASTNPISSGPPYTMAVMAYRTAVGTSIQNGMSWSRDDAEYVELGFNGSPSFARIRGGGTIVDTSGPACAANAWHNLALIAGSNSSRSLYTNGTVTAGSATSAVVGGSFFTPLTMGSLQRAGNTSDGLFTGYVKWAAIWNRVLTQAELNEFFANPSALFVSTALTFSGPVPAQSGTVGTASTALALAGYFSGGTTPYAYSVFSGALPPGLALGASTGQITGTATSAGSYSAVIRVTDAASGIANTGAIAWTISAPPASAVTLTGPSGGQNGVASAAFTLAANGAISGSHVITPSSGGGGGTFTPATVTLTAGSPTGTFTYTPSSTGAKTISAADAGGYSAPAPVTYTVSAVAGTFTSEVLKDNTGALVALQTLTHFTLYDNTTGALIVRKTGLSTNSAGVVSFSDGALLAGTTYRADWLTAAGHYRMPAKAAT